MSFTLRKRYIKRIQETNMNQYLLNKDKIKAKYIVSCLE